MENSARDFYEQQFVSFSGHPGVGDLVNIEDLGRGIVMGMEVWQSDKDSTWWDGVGGPPMQKGPVKILPAPRLVVHPEVKHRKCDLYFFLNELTLIHAAETMKLNDENELGSFIGINRELGINTISDSPEACRRNLSTMGASNFRSASNRNENNDGN